MAARMILGAALLALPFVVVAVVCVRELGMRVTIGIFAFVSALIAIVSAGAYLLTGGLS